MKEHKLKPEIKAFVHKLMRQIEKAQDQLSGAITYYCDNEGISETPWQLSPDGSKLIAPEDKKE